MRSIELSAWLASHTNSEDLASDLGRLTAPLRRELLCEALASLGSSVSAPSSETEEAEVLRRYCVSASDLLSAQPGSALADRLLFAGSAEPGRCAKTAFTTGNIRFGYEGITLTAFDRQVFEAVIALSGGAFGSFFPCELSDIVRRLGLDSAEEEVFNAVKRLSAAAFSIEVRTDDGSAAKRHGFCSSAVRLIDIFDLRDGRLRILLDRRLAPLLLPLGAEDNPLHLGGKSPAEWLRG